MMSLLISMALSSTTRIVSSVWSGGGAVSGGVGGAAGSAVRPALALGLSQGEIRLAGQALEVGLGQGARLFAVVLGEDRHAERHGQVGARLELLELAIVVFAVLPDTFGEQEGLLDALAAHQEKEELLAAVAAEQVLLADGELDG